MKNVEQLTEFFRYDTLLMFYYKDKYYVFDVEEDWLGVDEISSLDKPIGEYDIEIAKFIIRLYDKNL